ncbi:MAG: radical SAM protein [Candidatus Thorarchaeota archaeon]
MNIRASIATAALLKLTTVKLLEEPTTAYLMLQTESHCLANCMFCPQAKESSSKLDKLSRVLWPSYNSLDVIKGFKENPSAFKRICIQTVRYQGSTKDLLSFLDELAEVKISIPISVCSYPLSKQQFAQLKKLGVERIGISFDCATEEIFERVKGKSRGKNLSWLIMEKTLQKAVEIFGNTNVSTHLIVGLGETEREAITFLQSFHDRNITIGLFAFTPIRGTSLEKCSPPNINSYRRIQLAHFLIRNNISEINKMIFSNEGEISHYGLMKEELGNIINTGEPFKTSGCSNCNRPFYNESPGKEMYNFPRLPHEEEMITIRKNFDLNKKS